MPVIKTEQDRLAIRQAATSGEACFFLGTDSAPHPVARKLGVGRLRRPLQLAGLRSRPMRKIFEEDGKLENFEAFASLNGPKHYGLPPNADTITLEKTSWKAPEEVLFDGPEERALIYRGGEDIPWKVVSA